jgi:hypothetical protein
MPPRFLYNSDEAYDIAVEKMTRDFQEKTKAAGQVKKEGWVEGLGGRLGCTEGKKYERIKEEGRTGEMTKWLNKLDHGTVMGYGRTMLSPEYLPNMLYCYISPRVPAPTTHRPKS